MGGALAIGLAVLLAVFLPGVGAGGTGCPKSIKEYNSKFVKGGSKAARSVLLTDSEGREYWVDAQHTRRRGEVEEWGGADNEIHMRELGEAPPGYRIQRHKDADGKTRTYLLKSYPLSEAAGWVCIGLLALLLVVLIFLKATDQIL